MSRTYSVGIGSTARLLQHRRVQATVDVQDYEGNTALHHVCCTYMVSDTAPKLTSSSKLAPTFHSPTTADRRPLPSFDDVILNNHAKSLLEQVSDAEKASLLVTGRRLAAAAASSIVAPSCLEDRVARDQPLPCVTLMSVASGNKKAHGKRKLRKGRARERRHAHGHVSAGAGHAHAVLGPA